MIEPDMVLITSDYADEIVLITPVMGLITYDEAVANAPEVVERFGFPHRGRRARR